MWMLLCQPLIVPTRITEQQVITTKKCMTANVRETDAQNQFIVQIIPEIPPINIDISNLDEEEQEDIQEFPPSLFPEYMD